MTNTNWWTEFPLNNSTCSPATVANFSPLKQIAFSFCPVDTAKLLACSSTHSRFNSNNNIYNYYYGSNNNNSSDWLTTIQKLVVSNNQRRNEEKERKKALTSCCDLGLADLSDVRGMNEWTNGVRTKGIWVWLDRYVVVVVYTLMVLWVELTLKQ